MIWRLIAIALFGVASVTAPVAATGAAMLAVGLLWFSFAHPDLDVSAPVKRIAAAVLALLLVAIGSGLGSYGSPEPGGLVVALWIAGSVTAAMLVGWPRATAQAMSSWLAAALIVIVAVATVSQFGGNLFGLDVYRSHEAAADALAAGENPYTDAVRVLDGSPNAQEGAVIEGYAYPPVTLLAFSLGDWIGGDPRWATVAAIIAGLGFGLRTSGLHGLGGSVVVLLAATPTLRWIVWSGATEPLSFVLLIAAAALWRRPVVSAIVLGLALATKQYLIVLVPLVVLLDSRLWRRSWIAVSVAGVTLLPAFIADPGAFWYTLVERPLSLGFRPDTQSIAGALDQLGWRVDVPVVLMIAAVIAATWLFTRALSSKSPSVFLAGAAIALSIAFLFSSAFTNYWWLAQWLAAGAAMLANSDSLAGDEDRRLNPESVV